MFTFHSLSTNQCCPAQHLSYHSSKTPLHQKISSAAYMHPYINIYSGGADQHYMVTKNMKASKLATIKATFISKYH